MSVQMSVSGGFAFQKPSCTIEYLCEAALHRWTNVLQRSSANDGVPMEGFAMSKTIPLTQGRVAIVDDADYEWLSQWRWCVRKRDSTYYAVRGVRINGKVRAIHMHRVIVNPPLDKQIDHINGDGLDNRRCNLRLCTQSQNNMNSRKRNDCSSIYKGVTWHKREQKWHARIKMNGRLRHLGYFRDEDEAAKAYNQTATELFGSFARLNVIREEA